MAAADVCSLSNSTDMRAQFFSQDTKFILFSTTDLNHSKLNNDAFVSLSLHITQSLKQLFFFHLLYF